MQRIPVRAWKAGAYAAGGVLVLVLVRSSIGGREWPGLEPRPGRRSTPPSPSPELATPASGSGRAVVPAGRQAALDEAAEPPTAAPHPLAATENALAAAAEDSLQGIMHLNATLESMLAIASRPVDVHPDFDYEDNDAVAFRIQDLPEGMEGHVLVGLQPYEEDGRRYRYVQMEVAMPGDGSSFHGGVLREGPGIGLSISYDTQSPSTPTRFALMVTRRVDLAASRDLGIDAFRGAFTDGAYYWHDLLAPSQEPISTTIGTVDGNPANVGSFDGISPLAGDTRLDRDLLNTLLGRLQEHLSRIRGD